MATVMFSEYQEYMIKSIARAFKVPAQMLRDHTMGRRNLGGNSHQRRVARRSLQILFKDRK